MRSTGLRVSPVAGSEITAAKLSTPSCIYHLHRTIPKRLSAFLWRLGGQVSNSASIWSTLKTRRVIKEWNDSILASAKIVAAEGVA
jgi:hypothetical protein